MVFNSYDIVEMVLDEATEQYKHHFVVPKNVRKSLKADCDIIDRLVHDFECEGMDAGIDDETQALIVTLTCPDMILEYGRTHPFFTLIQHTSSFGFAADGDALKVNFVFTGIWKEEG